MLVLCLGLSPMAYAQSGTDGTYTFKVFLDDKEIGTQRFVVSSSNGRTDVDIEARFEVTFWFITAYRYRHINSEVWDGGCLRRIRSHTDDNGRTFFVRGTHAADRLTLVTHAGTTTVDGCVKTFAYWDQDFLWSRSLLNSQTGEMNPVSTTRLGHEVIPVRGRSTNATHYRLVADTFSVDLWYSPRGEWLALESTTADNARLRYELQ
jgi:hypothetical protein